MALKMGGRLQGFPAVAPSTRVVPFMRVMIEPSLKSPTNRIPVVNPENTGQSFPLPHAYPCGAIHRTFGPVALACQQQMARLARGSPLPCTALAFRIHRCSFARYPSSCLTQHAALSVISAPTARRLLRSLTEYVRTKVVAGYSAFGCFLNAPRQQRRCLPIPMRQLVEVNAVCIRRRSYRFAPFRVQLVPVVD